MASVYVRQKISLANKLLVLMSKGITIQGIPSIYDHLMSESGLEPADLGTLAFGRQLTADAIAGIKRHYWTQRARMFAKHCHNGRPIYAEALLEIVHEQALTAKELDLPPEDFAQLVL